MHGFNNIEEIILQYSNRGIDMLAPYLPALYCRSAAEELLSCHRGTVLIATGFYVNGHAETDGPPGAYVLANALKRLQFTPIIVTDIFCKDFFCFAEEIQTIYVPIISAPSFCTDILDLYKPVCMISVERCGRDGSAAYRNMRKIDITAHTAPIDNLFLVAPDNILTIGIGDGGNEIGMGNVCEIIERELNIIPSVISTTHCIISTTSNWGAYGLAAYLEKITGQNLFVSFANLVEFYKHIISLGSVDGVKGEVSLSVDGFDISFEEKIINDLKNINVPREDDIFSMSDSYDEDSQSQTQAAEELCNVLVSFIDRLNLKNCKLLDIGCGTGRNTNVLQQITRRFGISIAGLDVDNDILFKARHKYSSIDFYHGDIFGKNISGNYDVIYSNEALHWTPTIPQIYYHEKEIIYYFFSEAMKRSYISWGLNNLQKAFENIHAILSDSGLAFLQFGREGQLFMIFSLLNNIIKNEFPQFASGIKFRLFYPRDNDILKLAQKVGFEILKSDFYSAPLAEKNYDEMLRFIEGFTKNYLTKKLGVTNYAKFRSNLLSALQAQEGNLIQAASWNRTILVLAKKNYTHAGK